MKQQCTLWNIWFSWLAMALLAAAAALWRGWPAGLLVAVVAAAAQLLYLRFFPRLSPMLGYGSVADQEAASKAESPGLQVTFYTANLCPFCPIVRERLRALQKDMGFSLEEVDVTLRPALVRSKGLQSVPVVEARGRFLSGNATTAQLAEFLGSDETSGPALRQNRNFGERA